MSVFCKVNSLIGPLLLIPPPLREAAELVPAVLLVMVTLFKWTGAKAKAAMPPP
jgi:hypothetical protein